MVRLDMKIGDKFRLLFRNLFFILIFAVGAPTLLSIIIPSFGGLIGSLAKMLGKGILILPIILVVLAVVVSFKNDTSYELEKGKLYVRNKEDVKMYNLDEYELRSNIEITVGTLGIPNRQELILTSNKTGKKTKINFAGKDIKDVIKFMEAIEEELGIEIKSRYDK